jgi:hypothetical protein
VPIRGPALFDSDAQGRRKVNVTISESERLCCAYSRT